MFSLLAMLCFVKFTYAQIGITTCTAGGAECFSLPHSICDQFNTLTCVCSAAQKYYAKPDKSGCDYNCGPLTDPTNGAGRLGYVVIFPDCCLIVLLAVCIGYRCRREIEKRRKLQLAQPYTC